MTDLFEQKNALRRCVRGKTAALSPDYKKQASALISQALLSAAAFREAASVFIYISTPEEPETGEIIRVSLEAGKAVYVPKCVSKTEMLAVRIHSSTAFSPGVFGIPEPADSHDSAPAGKLDLAVIPCVCAAKNGARLGHGAGYYDRFLSGSGVRKYCLCFAALLAESLPVGENDVPMDAVITENGIYEKND